MLVMNERRIRDEKIAQLKKGRAAYTDSQELMRLINRGIERENLKVHVDRSVNGYWITPLEDKKSS